MPGIDNLQYLTSDEIAKQLVALGFNVVMVDNTISDSKRRNRNLQDLIIYFKVSSNTEFIWASRRTIVQNAYDKGAWIWYYWVNEIGSMYFPGSKIDGDEIRNLMGKRLIAGEPVILVRQTANAFDLTADDIKKLPLTRLDRILLAYLVGWVRRTGFPVIIALAPPDRALWRRWWPVSIRWKSAHRRFVRVRVSRLFWADPK